MNQSGQGNTNQSKDQGLQKQDKGQALDQGRDQNWDKDKSSQIGQQGDVNQKQRQGGNDQSR